MSFELEENYNLCRHDRQVTWPMHKHWGGVCHFNNARLGPNVV